MTDLDALVTEAAVLLRQAKHAVALTGAGISTPSGIPDFRSPNSGVWQNVVDPMEVASLYAFKRHPQTFYDWLRPLARLIFDSHPNPAHLALAELEAANLLKCVITQNIDLLHTRAGSQTIFEVHGHLRQLTCIACYELYEMTQFLAHFLDTGKVPRCPQCGGVLKPNVILFGEMLPVKVMNQAQLHARLCDVMLVAGSSLEVAPAGDLPLLAKQSGARVIIVNLGDTYMDHIADVRIYADVVDVLPRLARYFTPV
ncbi:MAG: NAD-dependent deacylase [Anaerolineales bacterium]|nr:NAD-dependent deacylase [Anaerolineales bacterium]